MKSPIILFITLLLVTSGCKKSVKYDESSSHIVQMEECAEKKSIIAYSSGRKLYKMDPEGNILWEKEISELTKNKNYCESFYYTIEQDTIIYAAYFLVKDTADLPELVFGKLNTNGTGKSNISKIKYPESYINDIEHIHPDQWLIASMNSVEIFDTRKNSLTSLLNYKNLNGQITGGCQMNENNILVSAIILKNDNYYPRIFNLTKQGKITWSRDLDQDSLQSTIIDRAIKLNDNEFLVIGDPDGEFFNLFNIAPDGNIHYTSKINLWEREDLDMMLPDRKNNLYLFGNIYLYDTESYQGLILKVDKNGNRIWSRIYRNKKKKTFHTGIILSDSTLLIAGKICGEDSTKYECSDILFIILPENQTTG